LFPEKISRCVEQADAPFEVVRLKVFLEKSRSLQQSLKATENISCLQWGAFVHQELRQFSELLQGKVNAKAFVLRFTDLVVGNFGPTYIQLEICGD
jgi:hypothetical protein